MVRERNLSLFSLYILSLILVEESDYIPSLLPPFFQHFQIPIEKQKSSERVRDRLKRERHYSRSPRKEFIRRRIADTPVWICNEPHPQASI